MFSDVERSSMTLPKVEQAPFLMSFFGQYFQFTHVPGKGPVVFAVLNVGGFINNRWFDDIASLSSHHPQSILPLSGDTLHAISRLNLP